MRDRAVTTREQALVCARTVSPALQRSVAMQASESHPEGRMQTGLRLVYVDAWCCCCAGVTVFEVARSWMAELLNPRPDDRAPESVLGNRDDDARLYSNKTVST